MPALRRSAWSRRCRAGRAPIDEALIAAIAAAVPARRGHLPVDGAARRRRDHRPAAALPDIRRCNWSMRSGRVQLRELRAALPGVKLVQVIHVTGACQRGAGAGRGAAGRRPAARLGQPGAGGQAARRHRPHARLGPEPAHPRQRARAGVAGRGPWRTQRRRCDRRRSAARGRPVQQRAQAAAGSMLPSCGPSSPRCTARLHAIQAQRECGHGVENCRGHRRRIAGRARCHQLRHHRNRQRRRAQYAGQDQSGRGRAGHLPRLAGHQHACRRSRPRRSRST